MRYTLDFEWIIYLIIDNETNSVFDSYVTYQEAIEVLQLLNAKGGEVQ
jgi:hypothetical protein